MNAPVADRRSYWILLLLLALTALAAFEATLALRPPTALSPELLGNAVAIDLTVGGTLVVWWLGVRRGGLPWVVLLPTFLSGLGLSHLLVGEHEPLALTGLEVVAVAAELTLLVVVFRGVSRAAREIGRDAGDPLVAVADRVRSTLGHGLAGRLAGAELGALWFATAGWLRPVPGHGRAQRFAYGKDTGAIYAAIIGVALVEVFAVHLLVSRWSEAVAWVLTALSIYSVLWLLGDWRAVRLRPITVHPDRVVLRAGLRWTLEVPRDRIVAVRRRDWRRPFGEEEGDLSLALFGDPDVVIELAGPLTAAGPFGIRREGSRIGVSVDDPTALVDSLSRRPPGGSR